MQTTITWSINVGMLADFIVGIIAVNEKEWLIAILAVIVFGLLLVIAVGYDNKKNTGYFSI